MIIVLIFVFQVFCKEHLRHRIRHTIDQMLIGPNEGGLFAEIARQQDNFQLKNDNSKHHHHKHHVSENCINAIHIIHKDQQDYKSLKIEHTGDNEQITSLEIKQMINLDPSDLEDNNNLIDSRILDNAAVKYSNKDNAIDSDQIIKNLASQYKQAQDTPQSINYFKGHSNYETKKLYDDQLIIEDNKDHQQEQSQQVKLQSPSQSVQQESSHLSSSSDNGQESILSKLFKFEHVNSSPEHFSSDLTKVEEVINQLDDEPIKNKIHNRIIEKAEQLSADPIQIIPTIKPQESITQKQSITDSMTNLKPVSFDKKTEFHMQQSQKKEEKQQRIAEVKKEIENQLKEKQLRETHVREKSDYAYESSYLEWQVNSGQGPDYAIKL